MIGMLINICYTWLWCLPAPVLEAKVSPNELSGNPGQQLPVDGSDTTGKEPITFQWSGPPQVTISDPNQPKTTLSAVTPGEYTVVLTVTDPNGQQNQATVTLVVTEPGKYQHN